MAETEALSEFFDRVTDNAVPEFRGEPWYNRYGDCIHYHWREDEFCRVWVDDKLTVYRAIESGDAVGCEIKGVSALLKKLGDFGISINEQDGTPMVLFLFASQQTAKASAENDGTYRYLIEQVAKKRVEVGEAMTNAV